MKIGFIGLGTMGNPMVVTLMNAGNKLVVYDVNEKSVDALVEKGAIKASTISELCAQVELLAFSLPNDKIVTSVIDEIMKAEKCMVKAICDLSSISPNTCLALAERLKTKDILYFDCPVSGGAIGAQNGSLTIIIGAEEKDTEIIKPVISALGKNFYYMGKTGSGSAAKVMNQYLGAACLVSNCEMLAVAKKFDIDLNKLMDVIQHSSGNSCQVGFFVAPFVENRNFDPKFTLELFTKDVSLMVKLAEELGTPLPVGDSIFNCMQMAKNLGYGKEDAMAVIKLYEQFIGETIN